MGGCDCEAIYVQNDERIEKRYGGGRELIASSISQEEGEKRLQHVPDGERRHDQSSE